MSTIAASVGLLAMLATLAWCALLLLHRPICGWAWCYDVLTTAKTAGAVAVFFATFTLGLWITSPPFPAGRKFVAVELNGRPIISAQSGTKLPTLEVWRAPFTAEFNAGGTGHCNSWSGRAKLLPPNLVFWKKAYQTAVGCAASDLEAKYLRALLQTNLWRIEKGALILTNGTDTLRFLLSPA
ncbi:MAG: META domain-containing protein [Alphaproteobacteria bacterium]|nr:MAG: META domain-containing protein [Alphaproteobacteria bacterium]